MSGRLLPLAFAVVAGLFWPNATALSAPPLKLVGALGGIVRDSAGAAQMGASVSLYNRFNKLVQKALTDDKGLFAFDALPNDTYSIRVHMASFVPAVKENIAVQPGMRSFLAINLAGVFSSIEVVYTSPNTGSLMSDDWKWVLRSSLATRPILRALPDWDDAGQVIAKQEHAGSVFSDTRGLVRFSAGDSTPLAGAATQPDLGTAFALATSLFGSNQLFFSGNLGYVPRSGMPTAAFRTTYSRAEPGSPGPEVSVTMRQVMLPGRAELMAIGGPQDSGAPMLRSVTVGTVDRIDLTDTLRLEYGASMDSVTFLNHMTSINPFARATYSLGDAGSVQVAYSSGGPAIDLLNGGTGVERELQADVAALSFFPRVSLRDSRAQLQRSTNYEAGYRKVWGSRTFNVGYHRESISNAALTMSVPSGFEIAGDLLPDLSSNSSIFNVGRYRSVGYIASVTQSLGDRLSITAAFGNGGSLRTDERTVALASATDLRDRIHSAHRNWAEGQVAGSVPGLGLQFIGTYQWTDYRALTPVHVYLTQPLRSEPGLNLRLRQPIPRLGILPGHFEATAELRNLLAQGYLPLDLGDGQRLLLIQSPRSVRGGFNFNF